MSAPITPEEVAAQRATRRAVPSNTSDKTFFRIWGDATAYAQAQLARDVELKKGADLTVEAPVTELPKLPEGMFWRVREHDVPPFGYRTEYTPYVDVVLVQESTIHFPGRQKARFWTGKLYWDVEPHEEKVQHSLSTSGICYPYSDKDRGGKPIFTDFVTKEDIARTALAIWTAYERGESAKALLGDYPPKKL